MGLLTASGALFRLRRSLARVANPRDPGAWGDDPAQLDPSFLGREIDERFLSDLPEQVDPCGENGEFHTFVFDGPSFSSPVPFSIGERVIREGFWFCDLLPAGS